MRQAGSVARFGEFELDADRQELRRAGRRVRLQRKPFEILRLLIDQRHRVVTRDELREALWPADMFVDFDNGLNTALNKLRTALRDKAASPRYVETIGRRGYRFIATLEVEERRDRAAEADAVPATTPNAASRPVKISPVSIALLLLAAAFAFTVRVRNVAPPDFSGSILIADFDNSTREPVFDGALKHAVAVTVAESRFVTIVDDERVREALALMRRGDEPVTKVNAREVCQRTGANAFVAGSIARLAETYVVSLEAIACETGRVLGREQALVGDRGRVLGAVASATTALRRALGDSRPSMTASRPSIEPGTTRSLDALKAFSEGERLFYSGRQIDATAYYKRAIELDGEFALALARLGVAYSNNGEAALRNASLTRAFELSHLVSERERLYIRSHYHRLVKGDIGRSREIYEIWTHAFPRDAAPHTSLGLIHIRAGERQKALRAFQAAVARAPNNHNYSNITLAHLHANRLADARASLDEWSRRVGDTRSIHESRFLLSFLTDDRDGLRRHAAAVAEEPEAVRLLTMSAEAAAAHGEVRRAHALFERAAEAAARLGLGETAANTLGIAGVWDAELGDCASARRRLRHGRAGAAGGAFAGLELAALAICGGEAAIDQRLTMTGTRGQVPPHVRARALLHDGKSSEALRLLTPQGPADFAGPLGGVLAGQSHGLAMVWVRGLAYLATRAPDRAASEFERILDNPGIAPLAPYHALASLRLAQTALRMGDIPRAEAACTRFRSRWRAAERDVPVWRAAIATCDRVLAEKGSQTPH